VEEVVDKYTNRKRAILFINLFALTIPAIGMVFRKAVENGVSTLDFSIARALILFCTMSIINIYKKQKPWQMLPLNRVPTVLLRSSIGFINFIMYMLAVKLIPLSLAVILMNLSPFWCSLLGNYFNKEPIYRVEFLAMAVCFLCVIGVTLTKPQREEDSTNHNILNGVILTIAVSVTMASAGVVSRRLKDVPFEVTFFLHSILIGIVPLLC